jgi:predicted MFS family arabinose efflux permease
MLPLAVLLFVGTFVLPDRAPELTGAVRQSWLGSYRVVLANRPTVLLLGMMMCLAAVWFAWFIYFGAFAHTAVGVSAGVLSALFLAGAAGELVGNNVAPALLTRLPIRPLLLSTITVLALCLIGVGGVAGQPWMLFPFITIASVTTLALFLFVSILQLDTMPSARGGVMALNSASLEVGGALGIAGMGLILVLFNGDYPAAYRTIGILALVLLVPIAVAVSSQRDVIPASEPAPEITPLV